jgi:hypothetical protein
MPFPLTPYLAMVLAGFALFIVALAFGSMTSGPDKPRQKS